jgi:hypothetical protein
MKWRHVEDAGIIGNVEEDSGQNELRDGVENVNGVPDALGGGMLNGQGTS